LFFVEYRVVLGYDGGMDIFPQKHRDNFGVSQDKLSKFVGVALHALTKIETGAMSDICIETVKKIAKGLNVSVDGLIK